MNHRRVVVAMSGGVDSSLVAARLLNEGYDVIGVTMLLFDTPEGETKGLSSAIRDAKRVADALGIVHYVLDFRAVFKTRIIDYFVSSYARGVTPNPCVLCNEQIKFGELFREARKLGADFMATGHYARVIYNARRHLYEVHKGADEHKDQSYVLYHLNQEVLPYFLFPLGEMQKENTREEAKKLGLPIYNKPESQDICFIPDNNHLQFLRDRVPQAFQEGDIVDRQGRTLGRHKGLPAYTVGQRKGLGIAADRPLYVVALDVANNRLIVGDDDDIFTNEVWAVAPSYVEFEALSAPLAAEGKVRYGAIAAPCMMYPERGGLRVRFESPQRAITPGQSIVFFDGDRLLGGAIIAGNGNGENK